MKLRRRLLGSTGLEVSEVSFGAGPVAGLLTSDRDRQLQRATIERALEVGINWFDTAATYGAGQSELNLGRAFQELGAIGNVHLATKVRVMPNQLDRIKKAVKSSVAESLQRLGCDRITLLQVHNSITCQRGVQPNSITPDDVIGPNGILDALSALKKDGTIRHFGLTGLGETAALREVIGAAEWATIQVPWNLLSILDERASAMAPESLPQLDLLHDCAETQIAVIAIRVFAAGALADRPPSAHTFTTPYFPLTVYQRDQARARILADKLPGGATLKEAAVRSVLGDARVSTALIGFGNTDEIDEAVRFANAGPLAPELIKNLRAEQMESTEKAYEKS